ncbi:pyrroloquinoline quinone biosynthesis protein PqqB [Wenjunlia tyrosinilytica]|jgi:pyrroloquinoline quinone biosynthesis protein B|uniref:Coenzyme PQQ synthesis protein B n=1 Tax=Wenjunlia tyrosinilytica TaxID=1544741 RepID=A0A917ZD61_9ACTN|nr:pyrroloquinoline quinone biosynthesis protein PqqB [Wenjunlia tyrosinilytica]GGO80648.1 coenzyme PQQ synthesis protein B [Wenjunlia tyrosinilytica]
MLLQVLGTAAGGGIPQWNCACPGCLGARAHPGRRRRHASIAIRAAQARWFVVNATPDIADQIEDSAALRPGPGPRETPLAGVVLTDAELDHTLGMARLREAQGFDVFAAPAVRDALITRLRLGEVLGPYTGVAWRELPRTRSVPLTENGSIEISGIKVSGKRPRYAADAEPHEVSDDTWVVALRISDRETGTAALYAPAMAAWPEEFDAAAREADCVIVDGTFWDDEEPRRTGISRRTATGMGHLPIEGPAGTADRLAKLGARHRLYTHLNNTNPLVDPDAPQHRALAERGIEVADDGMVIEL